MKYLKQLATIFAFCVCGDLISALLGGIMPGNVIGMTLLFLCLLTGFLKMPQVESTADFFLSNMAFFFLPACLGILTVYPQIKQYLFPMLAIILLTTLLTAAATAYTVHFVLQWQASHKKEGK